MSTQELLQDGEGRMRGAQTALQRELSSIRTGRASPALVDHISVDYYGAATPLNQLASITSPEARLLVIQPWDKQSLREIEKSLMKSDMGFNPSNDGNIVTVPIPPLTTERRQDLVKVLKRKIEEGKVSVRNVRRGGQDALRRMEKDKLASQDQVRRAQDQLQKATDEHTKTMDQVAAAKEAEIMQV